MKDTASLKFMDKENVHCIKVRVERDKKEDTVSEEFVNEGAAQMKLPTKKKTLLVSKTTSAMKRLSTSSA